MLVDMTQAVARRALDAAAERHRAIAANIANVETPGYLRADVKFEDEMRSALQSNGFDPNGRERDVRSVGAEHMTDTASPARENGNNVDADREMARLAENTYRYQALAQSLKIKGDMLRAAISEGRR